VEDVNAAEGMNAALACKSCSWFGVYRSDVALALRGCPNCGADSLVLRDLEDTTWRQLGTELLADIDHDTRAQPRPRR
jgi:hypothetical protein